MNQLSIKDFKYSYNRFDKVYRVQIKEQGKWRRNIYDKINLENALKYSIPSEIRNYPYKPYLFYIIKWGFMSFVKWIIKTDPKIKTFTKGGFFVLIGYILAFFPKSVIPNKNQDIIKLLLDKEKTIQIHKTSIDSLMEVIKQKEATINEFEQAQKEQTLMTSTDSIKK